MSKTTDLPPTTPPAWVLGSSNDRKIEQLEQRVRDLDERLAAAQKTTEELTRRERESMAVCRIFEMLDSKSWSDYDLRTRDLSVSLSFPPPPLLLLREIH